MSTRSVVAYKTQAGETRGVYVHFDGYPENMLPELNKRFEEEGYAGSVEWIEEGIQGGGYSSVVDTEPYNDNDDIYVWGLKDEEYGYLITGNGVELAWPTSSDER